MLGIAARIDAYERRRGWSPSERARYYYELTCALETELRSAKRWPQAEAGVSRWGYQERLCWSEVHGFYVARPRRFAESGGDCKWLMRGYATQMEWVPAPNPTHCFKLPPRPDGVVEIQEAN